MINLLAKDFKLLFSKDKSPLLRIFSLILSLLFIALIIVIEVVVFNVILNNIKTTKNAQIAYVNLFLFIIEIIIIILNIKNAKKLFFNQKDIEQLATKPVTNSQVVVSKLIFMFLTHYASTIVLVYPLLISYSTHFRVSGLFFYFGLLYPVFTFLFEAGVALILVYPIYLLSKFLKKHFLVNFFLVLAIFVVGTLLYAFVLQNFMEILLGGNIAFLKSNEVIANLFKIRNFSIPNRFLVDAFFASSRRWLLSYFLISLGVFIIGLTASIFAFNYVRNFQFSTSVKDKKKHYHQMSIKKALLKKEVILLMKNSDYMVSFTGLLIVQPVLVYLVLVVLNQLFRAEIFASISLVIPNFTTLLDVLIVMLFSVIVASGACEFIQMEKRTIKVMKTIPVNYQTQLFIKVLIPFVLSSASLIITLVVLTILKIFNFQMAIFSFLIAFVLLFIFNITSLKEELKIRNHFPRSYFKSSMYSYLVPVCYFGISCFLSYLRISLSICLIFGLLVVVIIAIFEFITLLKKAKSWFLDLDVVN